MAEKDRKKLLPYYLPATPETMRMFALDYSDADWWYVRNSSTLARRLMRCYPEFEPVVDDTGELVDIVDLNMRRYHETKAKEKAEREAQRQKQITDAKERGYERDFVPHNQPNGLGFIADILFEIIKGSEGK